MIRKSMPSGHDPMGGYRFSLGTNAKRLPGDHTVPSAVHGRAWTKNRENNPMQSRVNPGSQHSCCAASGREKKNAPSSWPQPNLIPLEQKARFIPGFFIFRLDLSGALGVPLGEFH